MILYYMIFVYITPYSSVVEVAAGARARSPEAAGFRQICQSRKNVQTVVK